MDINKEAAALASKIRNRPHTTPTEDVSFVLQSFERICREQREQDKKAIYDLGEYWIEAPLLTGDKTKTI